MFNSLRKYKPYELPELWNVLKGEKSLKPISRSFLKPVRLFSNCQHSLKKLDRFSFSKIFIATKIEFIRNFVVLIINQK